MNNSNNSRTNTRTNQDWKEPWVYKGVPHGQPPDITKEWTLFYRYRKPGTNKFPRFKGKSGDMNRYHTLKEREEAGEIARIALLELLQEGRINPFASEAEREALIPKTTTEALAEAFKRIQKRKVTTGTKATRKSFHKLFSDKLNEMGYGTILAEKIRYRHIEAVVNAIQEKKNYTNNSYNTMLSVVKDLFKEFIKMDIRTDNVAELIDNMPWQRDTGYHKRFDKDEDEIIDKSLSQRHPGLLLFRKFMQNTGRRKADILRILVKGIFLDIKTIYIGLTKNGKPDIAIITDELQDYILESGMLQCNPEHYIFSKKFKPGPTPLSSGYVKDMWKEYVKWPVEKGGLGIDKNIYGTKHTVATNLIKLGADPRLVQFLLGHADPETTEIYGKLDKRQAFEALQPYLNKLSKERA